MIDRKSLFVIYKIRRKCCEYIFVFRHGITLFLIMCMYVYMYIVGGTDLFKENCKTRESLIVNVSVQRRLLSDMALSKTALTSS